MRIDAHIHYTPPTMAVDMAGFAEQEPYWGMLLQPNPPHRMIQGWATAERMIADMDRAEIDRVVLVGEYPRQHDYCLARNNQAIQILNQWPDRIVAFATIQPKAGQQALDELKRCVEAGMQGVGELNPYAQGHTMDDPDFLRLVEACIAYDIPLNLHVSEAVGHYYLGKSATPLRHYYHLAVRYPELKLILAHWGGGLLFYEIMPRVRRELQNVWYDTAASPLLYPTAKIFQLALQAVDHRKLLYGSDYPLLLYPRRQQEPDFRPFIAEIDALELEPEVYRDIMGHNAARLFGLLEDERERPTTPISRGGEEAMTEEPVQINLTMPVSLVAKNWPETRSIFEEYGIPWRDSPLPHWEPLQQAAAARGFGPSQQQNLLAKLNDLIGAAAQTDRVDSAT